METVVSGSEKKERDMDIQPEEILTAVAPNM